LRLRSKPKLAVKRNSAKKFCGLGFSIADSIILESAMKNQSPGPESWKVY
jgi:hypothetical protein